MIASLHHPLVKHLVKLREQHRYRKESGTVLITGSKLVKEVAAHTKAKRLFVTKESDTLPSEEVYLVTEAVLKKITALPSPEGIAAEFPLPEPHPLLHPPLLILDAIRDPGNLGTLLRTALALGWKGVFLLPTCVDLFNDKVIRSSRAAPFYLPWRMGNLEELSELCREIDIYIADMEGTPLHTLEPSKKIALLLSNEGEGVNPQTAHLGKRISIPMSGRMESLNVGLPGAS